MRHTADARVAVGEPRTAKRFENIVELFTLVEGVQKEREGTGIQPHRPDGDQMVANPCQLRDNHAQVLAAGCQLDPHQRLDRMMPGHVIGHRRNVIHAIGDGHVLVVIQLFTNLLETRMQIPDIGHRVDNPFPIQFEDQPQSRVRGRMLGAKVQGPDIILPSSL